MAEDDSALEYVTNSPEELAAAREEAREPRHQSSLTGVAEDAAQSGVVESPPGTEDEVPAEEILRVGEPDVDLLESEYSGEEPPDGSTPPGDSAPGPGEREGVVTSEGSPAPQDHHRWELDPRSKDVER